METLKKTTIWPELTAIMLARLGVLWLIVLVSLLLSSDDAAFYAFMGIAFIMTIPYSLWLRSRLRTMQFAPLQFIVDLFTVTGLVYFTGGIHSEFTLLYPLVILSAGIVGTPRQATEITLLAILVYALMATVVQNQWLIEYRLSDSVLGSATGKVAVILRTSAFAFFGAASIYIAKRCDFTHTHKRQLANATNTLLESMPEPTMLLSEDGRILFANEPACYALKTTRDKLCSRKFAELRLEAADPIPESFGHAATLMREGSTPLPVSYQTRDFRIPSYALEGSNRAGMGEIKVTLLAFTDISDALKTIRQLDKVERITSATRIAGEMAHEIQAPLTTLSASVQLLKHYEEKATAADWLPNSPRRKDRNELFGHIEDATSRIDTSIKNFVDFAEFSPQDLLSIIKLDSIEENQGYIGHLNTIGRGFKDGQNSDSG